LGVEVSSKATRISDDEIRELQERAQALTKESEDLRLASELIARLGECVGVEDTMARLARLTLEAVCGARAAVWWRTDGQLLRVDALGSTRTPERIDSGLARAVFDGGRSAERASEGHAALVSWGIPLTVAGAVVGVLEVEDASVALREVEGRLSTFVDAAAAMIAAEAMAASECTQTCNDLRETNARLAVEVDECRRSQNGALDEAALDIEKLVADRTRALKTLARVTETLVRAYDERQLLQNVCDTVVDTGGYALCWVGFVEHDKNKTVRPVASAGKDTDYVDRIRVSWGTGRHGRGPSGKSIRRRKPVRVKDLLVDPNYLPWRDEAIRRGYRSSASFPLIDSAGEVFGTIAVYSEQPDAFGDEDMRLLNELARDLAFGVGTVRERKARAEAEKQVREAARYARGLVEVNVNPLVLISPEGQIADVNWATEEAIGIPRGQLIGTDFSMYFTDPKAAQLGYEKALAEGGVRDYPLTIRNVSGRLVDVDYTATVYRSETGELVGVFASARDVTKSRRDQAQAAQLAAIVSSSQDAIFTKDLDQVVTSWNDAAGELYGYSAEEMIGQGIEKVLPREKRDEARVLSDRVRRGERIVDFGTRHMRKDGSLVDIALTLSPISDDAGEIVGVSGIARDITDRVRAEAERLNHLRLVESLDRVNLAIQGTDDLDQMMKNVLGVIREVFQSDRAFLVFPCDPEADAWTVQMESVAPEYPGAMGLTVPMTADIAELYGELLASGTPLRQDPEAALPVPKATSERFGFKSMMSIALRPRTGPAWHFGLHQCSYARVWTDEELRLLQEFARRLEDALSLMLSHREVQSREAEFRRLVETASEGVARLDTRGVVTFCNARFAEMLGYTVEETVGREFEDLVIADETVDHREKMELRRQGRAQEYERRLQHKDGRTVWTHVSATPVLGETGEFVGSFGMITDITEAKRAEHESAERLRFAESMDRVNRAIQGAGSLEQMMSDVLDAVLAVFESDRAFLMHPCDPDSPTWTVPMERYRPGYPGLNELGADVPMDQDVARTLRVLIEANGPVRFGPGTPNPLPEDVSERFGFRSFMSMALYPRVGAAWQFGVHQCTYAREWTDAEAGLLAEIGHRLEDGLGSMIASRDLARSEAEYRRLIETSAEGIWVVGPDWSTTFANPKMAEMLGYSTEELTQGRAAGFAFEEDLSKHRRTVENLRQGVSEVVELRMRAKDGRTVWMSVSVAPIIGEAGDFAGAFGMATDITARKEAEESLRRRNEELERFERVVVGRELRMKELKARIAELEHALAEASGGDRHER
jgi:PAS domain S-box-containing protein